MSSVSTQENLEASISRPSTIKLFSLPEAYNLHHHHRHRHSEVRIKLSVFCLILYSKYSLYFLQSGTIVKYVYDTDA